MTMKAEQLDPLYVIFEQHLYNFQDSEANRKVFIGNIVTDYLNFLRKKNVIIPKSLEPSIVEELSDQVNSMLVKKIYGCLTIGEYQKKLPAVLKRKANAKYAKLGRR